VSGRIVAGTTVDGRVRVAPPSPSKTGSVEVDDAIVDEDLTVNGARDCEPGFARAGSIVCLPLEIEADCRASPPLLPRRVRRVIEVDPERLEADGPVSHRPFADMLSPDSLRPELQRAGEGVEDDVGIDHQGHRSVRWGEHGRVPGPSAGSVPPELHPDGEVLLGTPGLELPEFDRSIGVRQIVAASNVGHRLQRTLRPWSF